MLSPCCATSTNTSNTHDSTTTNNNTLKTPTPATQQLMKVSERRQMEEAAAQQLRVSPELIRGLSRPLKLALWDRGVRGLLSAGWRRPGASRSSSGSGSSGADDVIGADGVDAAAALRKRYAFVAATMPALSKEDAGSELQRRYKAAAWVSGDLLHRSKPAVAHKWVEVEGERAWAEALMQAVTGCEDYAAGRARVLVFARDVNSADSVSGGTRLCGGLFGGLATGIGFGVACMGFYWGLVVFAGGVSLGLGSARSADSQRSRVRGVSPACSRLQTVCGSGDLHLAAFLYHCPPWTPRKTRLCEHDGAWR